MQLSETVRLYMPEEQENRIRFTMREYIDTVNSLVSKEVNGEPISKYTTKDVHANLPSALKNQCMRDAQSILKKHSKLCKAADRKNEWLASHNKNFRVVPTLPVMKKPCCYINNCNFKIKDDSISFPVMVNGKSKRIDVKAKITDRQKSLFSDTKFGTLRIVLKGNSIVAQVVYSVSELLPLNSNIVMGIDLGIKCPAVSRLSNGKVKFFGNGRQNKYMRRHYAYLRRRLQKAKKPKAVKHIGDKEQCIMRDIDHKISREIVSTALENNVSVIKLEQLSNIRSTTRTSRKNNHSLHNWSFYRLAQFIEYKAKLAGIEVKYVNPAYTSQTCPVCGKRQHAQDRKYTCKCGFHTHRDIVGAWNICDSTEYVGNRRIA